MGSPDGKFVVVKNLQVEVEFFDTVEEAEDYIKETYSDLDKYEGDYFYIYKKVKSFRVKPIIALVEEKE